MECKNIIKGGETRLPESTENAGGGGRGRMCKSKCARGFTKESKMQRGKDFKQKRAREWDPGKEEENEHL